MSIIDQYLLRQFFKTFVICFLSLMGLYIILDCTTHMDDFLRCGEKSGGVLKLMGRLYGYRTLGFFDRTSNILTLVSVMFTVAWIQRHNEMTALMAAGVSRIRVIKPLIFAAVAICLLAAVSRETIIPYFREELARKTEDLLGDKGQKLKSVYDSQTMVLIGGLKTYADRKRIESPSFLLPEMLWQYGKQVSGENAYYLPPEEGKNKHPGGYLFEGVKEPKNLNDRPSIPNGKPVLITPHDMPDWLKPNQCFIVSDLNFELLTGGVEFSSAYQLIAGLHNLSGNYGADVRRTIHSRFVQPLLDIVLLFLALPLVVRRESRKVFLAIGVCMGITTLFMFTVIGFQWLGDNSYLVSPALAAWAPLMIFVPAAVGLSQAMWE